MKYIFLLLTGIFIYSFAVYGETKIVCDEETGVCSIVEIPQENSASDLNRSKVIRRHVGMCGANEFMAFLKGEDAESADATAFWSMMVLALLGGLALNLTPCVLPMLPINLAIIGANGGKRGFFRGLLYGIGMALMYGILGILAAFAGVSFGTLNSSPWFNFAIGAIFTLLGMAMAGVFNIDASRYRIRPGSLKFTADFTALAMGAVSALLAGACVAPVVISVLIFAANSVQSGAWYGAFAPFVLGIGMALPWPLAGAGLSILPKPGRFMLTMKYIFAGIIFCAAAYYVYMGICLLPEKGMAAEDVPADGFAMLKAAEKTAEQTGKPVLIKFTASWCKNCHAMDKNTLRDPEVANYIRENFIPVTFPAEDPNEPAVKEILDKYQIPGFPAFVIVEY